MAPLPRRSQEVNRGSAHRKVRSNAYGRVEGDISVRDERSVVPEIHLRTTDPKAPSLLALPK